ncbi:MAG: hypothetical protein ACO1O6_05425 [Bacteroidota bacterium]
MKAIALLFILCSGHCLAQGFLGKQNIVDLTLMGNVPLLSGSLKETEYKPRKNQMVRSKDYLDYGLSLNYLHYTGKGRCFGFKSAVKRLDLSMPGYFVTRQYLGYTRYTDTTYLRFQSVKYTNFYLAPSFEFTTKKGYAGVGLSYDVAAGICLTYMQNGSYAYSINEFSPENEASWSETDYVNTAYQWPRITSYFVQTGFKLRYPVSKRMLFYSGLHYTVMKSSKPKTFEKEYRLDDIYRNENLYYQVEREDLFTINFDLGLSFTF